MQILAYKSYVSSILQAEKTSRMRKCTSNLLSTLQTNACAFRWLSGEFEMCAHLRWRGSGNLRPMVFIRLTGGLNGSTIGP